MEDIHCWQAKFESCGYSDRLIGKLTILNKIANNQVDLREVKKAIYYARKYHGSQMRKSGEPYYSHPIEVAYMVADCLFRTDIIVTALLHDTIEDTELTKENIACIFNNYIADQVEDLTRIKFNRKITAGENINLLFTEYKKDVLHVKLFDRLHNVQTISAMPPDKAKKIIDETVIHFIPLASYLGLYKVKKKLIKLCSKNLSPKQTACQCQQDQAGFCHCHSPFSPIVQSVINQVRNL